MQRLVGRGLMGLAIVALALACDDGGTGAGSEGDPDGGAGGQGGGPGVLDATIGGGGAGGGLGPDMAQAPDPDQGIGPAPDTGGGPAPDMDLEPPPDAEPGPDPDMGDDPDPPMGATHSGRIDRLSIAGMPAQMGCRDLNGDGAPDNSLALAAALANDALQGAVDDGSLTLMPTAIGLAPPGMDGMFDLALLTADPEGADYRVDDASLNEDGSARIVFPTEVQGGQLNAGPGNFPVAIPVGGMELELDITNATIEGTAGIDANGFYINNGVISGVIPHDALVAALEQTDFAFAAGLLPPDINGTGNSICLNFSSVGATLLGFPAE